MEYRESVRVALVWFGIVRVASGGGWTLDVVIRNIDPPTAFGDEVRNLIRRERRARFRS